MSAGLISSRSKSSLRPTSSTRSCAMRRALARTSGRERRRIRCAACSCVSCARNSMLHPRTTSARRSASPRASVLPRSTGVICEEENYVDLVQPAEKGRKIPAPRGGGEVRILLCRAPLRRAQPIACRRRCGGENAAPLSQNEAQKVRKQPKRPEGIPFRPFLRGYYARIKKLSLFLFGNS